MKDRNARHGEGEVRYMGLITALTFLILARISANVWAAHTCAPVAVGDGERDRKGKKKVGWVRKEVREKKKH